MGRTGNAIIPSRPATIERVMSKVGATFSRLAWQWLFRSHSYQRSPSRPNTSSRHVTNSKQFIITRESGVVMRPVVWVSLCNDRTFERLDIERVHFFGMREHPQNLQAMFVDQGHLFNVKVTGDLMPPPLLWQTRHSLAVNAVTASPFKSFRVRRYLLAAMLGAANRRVQTSNCSSAPDRTGVWNSIFRSVERRCSNSVFCLSWQDGLPSTEMQSC